MIDLTGLPFEIPNILFGFKSVKGVIRVREKSLIFEFYEKDMLGGFIKNEMHEVEIPSGDIRSVTLIRGVLKSNVILGILRSKKTDLIPGISGNGLVLKIPREFRADADRLVTRIRKIMESDLSSGKGRHL